MTQNSIVNPESKGSESTVISTQADWIGRQAKIFSPTETTILDNGVDAITQFKDSNNKTNPDHHAVAITQGLLDTICERAKRDDDDGVNAREVQDFIGVTMTEYAKTNRISVGTELYHTPIPVGDNLSIVILPNDRIDDPVIKTNKALMSKLRVMCTDEGENVHYKLRGISSRVTTFDKVDPEIRKKGVKVINNNDLYSRLLTHQPFKQHTEEPRVDLDVFRGYVDSKHTFHLNQYLIVQDEQGKHPIIGYVVGDVQWRENHERFIMGSPYVKILNYEALKSQDIFGVKPRDIIQMVYLHALKQPHISRIFATGLASSGKTLLGYASALEQTMRQLKEDSKATRRKDPTTSVKEQEFLRSRFDRVYILKTVDRIGGEERSQGWLKGTMEDKLWPLAGSYRDAHDKLRLKMDLEKFLHGLPNMTAEKDVKWEDQGKGYFAPRSGGLVILDDYAMWRGRTIDRSVVFIDEAQNFKPREIKDLNTRGGDGPSLFIITGDYIGQRDREVTATKTGLFRGIRHALGEPWAAVFNLEGSYRDMASEHFAHMR